MAHAPTAIRRGLFMVNVVEPLQRLPSEVQGPLVRSRRSGGWVLELSYL